MRTILAAISLSVLLSSAAFAQVPMPPEGAGASAQPQMPAVVADPTINVPPLETSSSNKMPMSPIPGTKPGEPNLKMLAGSGGKSNSPLIKDAPLPTDYAMGKPDAPVVMIEYASLSCPHCAHFSATTLPELEKKYINTGKLLYILRPFPLNEPALKGAMLLDCVGQQQHEKYYTFARVLFDAQAKWAFNNDWMSGLETIATVGGLTKEQFEHCVNNTDREMKVLKIKKQATDELQVPHTPYIFIAGEAYEGDRSIEAMSPFIDAKLEEAKKAKK